MNHLAVLWVQRGAEQHVVAPFAGHLQRHGDRFRGRGCPVVVRDIGRFHAGERGNHRLIFEMRLQRALADLRLVGGIGGGIFRPLQQHGHHAGHEMPIGARAEETGARRPHPIIVRRQRLELAQQLHFGECGRQVKCRMTVGRGDILK